MARYNNNYEDPTPDIANELKRLTNFSDLNAEKLVDYADKTGKHLQSVRLKTNQIRKFLSALSQIKSSIKTEKKDIVRREDLTVREKAFLLKPKLAYAASRQAYQIKPLMTVLDPAIESIHSNKDLLKLATFVESIVAYHKYYGGRD